MTGEALAGARIRRARWHPGARTFELLLDTDAAAVLLRYRNVSALEPELPRLAALVEDVSARIAAEHQHGHTHRLTLVPAGEIVVTYGALERSEQAATAGYDDAGFRFDIRSC